jgi:putative nucleotidyltransferase with HDIG domain
VSEKRRDSVLESLSGTPAPGGRAQALHHGVRIILLMVVAIFITVLFPPSTSQVVGEYEYEVGMVATQDVIARVPFNVPKTQEELARERQQARESVPPTLSFVDEATEIMGRRLEAFFSRLDSAGDRAGIQRAVRELALVATPNQVEALSDPATRRLLQEVAERAVSELLPRGVFDPGPIRRTTGSVTIETSEAEESRTLEELLTQREFVDSAAALLPSRTQPDVSDLLRLILIRNMEYSLVLDVVATEGDMEAAAQSVFEIKGEVLQGEAIVRAADPIREDDQERLQAYRSELLARGLLEPAPLELGPLFGSWIINLMMLALFGLVVFFFRGEVYANLRWLLLVAILVAVYFAAAAAISRNGLAPEWLPIAFVALPVGALWDGRMSLVLVFVLGVVTGALPGGFEDYGTVLVVLAGGGAAALSVKAVRRRSQTWVSIAMIAAAMSLVLWGHGLTTGSEVTDVARASLISVGNATLSALLAMGFLWVFELFTGITTDQTLLEWADPARPLLRRLSMEAPGTYAHTINVANLSEAGANAIGANGLLCRVGVYYHDVGKMLKPHYFVENQPDGRNPHDKLKPHTSAGIVREHVTEGERLARDAKVPEVIIQFIREHHGTQKIGFFYEKAAEESDGDLDEKVFFYPGPKPQSRETAIVLMADACESATRAMKDPSPERVRDLIHSIFRSKLDAGQLDDAPLTLRELTDIETQFAKILSGVHHRRIEYPETKHLTDAPSHEEGSPAESRGSDPT